MLIISCVLIGPGPKPRLLLVKGGGLWRTVTFTWPWTIGRRLMSKRKKKKVSYRSPTIVITQHAIERATQRYGQPVTKEQLHNWVQAAKPTGQSRDGLLAFSTEGVSLLFMVLRKQAQSMSNEYKDGIYELQVVTVLHSDDIFEDRPNPSKLSRIDKQRSRKNRFS